jgi:hypothetical protein
MLSVARAYRCIFSCLRNVVALFHVIEQELQWRRENGRFEGFGAMYASKPIIAVGADHPLDDEMLMADYFRTCPSNYRYEDANSSTRRY